MTIRLNISVREPDPKLKYIPFKNIEQDFMLKKVKEVKKKRSKPTAIPVYTSILGAGLMLPSLSHAEEVQQIPVTTLDPQIVFEFSLKMALVGLGLSVGFTALLLIISSMLKQLGGKNRRDKSREWTTDIIKGFIQCLVAIPTVFALYYLAITIFGELDFTKSTFLNLP